MNIAIIYGTTTGQTADVAQQIKDQLGDLAADPIEVDNFDLATVGAYDALLLGIPTWDVGEMQYDWDMVADDFAGADLAGKTIALFGCGDQGAYADTFGDALGLLWDKLEPSGPKLVGRWSTDGYDYDASVGVREGKFLGLMCDQDCQPELTEERIRRWCEQLKAELEGAEVAAA
ncbi:MAG: flavodoxin [Planctomycetota bacterium]